MRTILRARVWEAPGWRYPAAAAGAEGIVAVAVVGCTAGAEAGGPGEGPGSLLKAASTTAAYRAKICFHKLYVKLSISIHICFFYDRMISIT